jgi:hypothetical protein
VRGHHPHKGHGGSRFLALGAAEAGGDSLQKRCPTNGAHFSGLTFGALIQRSTYPSLAEIAEIGFCRRRSRSSMLLCGAKEFPIVTARAGAILCDAVVAAGYRLSAKPTALTALTPAQSIVRIFT